MRRMIGVFAVACACAPLWAADDPDARITKALDRVNAIRKEIGQAPVQLDAKISAGCQAHAAYLVANPDQMGMQAHNEDPKKPGFSEEGKKAASHSVLYPGMEPLEAIEGWMGTLYHRVDLISPELKKIGIGYAPSKKKFEDWSVLDVFAGREYGTQKEPVLYPGVDQKNVALHLVPEVPDPIPEAKKKEGGFPITVTFPQKAKVKDATAKLTLDGKEIEGWLSSPEKPANPKYAVYQKNTICLIAKEALAGDKIYSVTASAMVNGKAWTKTWQFTTRKK